MVGIIGFISACVVALFIVKIIVVNRNNKPGCFFIIDGFKYKIIESKNPGIYEVSLRGLVSPELVTRYVSIADSVLYKGREYLVTEMIHVLVSPIGGEPRDKSNWFDTYSKDETNLKIQEAYRKIESIRFSKNLRRILTLPNTLEHVEFPDSLEEIDLVDLFSGNQRIKEIVIPKNVRYVEPGVIVNTPQLKKISISKDNPYFEIREDSNAVVEASTNTLCALGSDGFIPSSVERIDHGFFFICNGDIVKKIKCLAILPPKPVFIEDGDEDCDFYWVEDDDDNPSMKSPFEVTVIEVPACAIDIYRSNPSWGKFKNIVAIVE